LSDFFALFLIYMVSSLRLPSTTTPPGPWEA